MAAILLENRTISMILMVPDVDVSSSSATPMIERLDRLDTMKSDPTSDTDTISLMPVYQGSIVRIEQHTDDQNISDLIIRVPNFQHTSSPTMDTNSKSSTRTKRRAPLCPALYGPDPQLSTTNNTQDLLDQSHQTETRAMTPNRITTGLRSLSRAFTYGCISKRTTSISEIATPPSALPDVEVMNEKLQVITSANKNAKHSTPKLVPPKILSIKRKHSKMKKQSTEMNNTQTEQKLTRLTSTPTPMVATTSYAEVPKPATPKVTSFLHRLIDENPVIEEIHHKEEEEDDDDDKEQHNESIRLSFDVEQQFITISQLIADLRVSPTDAGSLSTHRYSTISANIPDIRISTADQNRDDVPSPELPSNEIAYDLNPKPSSSSPKMDRPFRVQTSILQPDISVIRVGVRDFTIGIDQRLPGEKDFIELISNIDQEEKEEIETEKNRYEVIQTNVETFAECYEVTYQMDSEPQTADQSIVSPKIIIDPFEYKNLALVVPTNDYEQIEHEKDIDPEPGQLKAQDQIIEPIPPIPQDKSRSVDDLSRTSGDQTSTYQPESVASSSSSSPSKNSSRHGTPPRSNSFNSPNIHPSPDRNNRDEQFIEQVDEEFSPGEQAVVDENDRILCIDGTRVIQEDYTVVLQVITHGLETDSSDFDQMTHDAFEQFKSEIDQLNQ